MSLQVWLPLNGNLNNQGLSNVSVTNNGATVDNNGKIGKCYSFGNSKRLTVSQPTNLSTTQVSLACWVNLSSWGSSYDSLVNLSTGTGWNDTRLAFVRNNQQNRIAFCVSNGSAYNLVTMSNDFLLNTWTHIVGVFNGSTIKIYVNGILNNSASTTFNSLVYGSSVLNIGSWSNAFNYPINGKINDVRIYDHCLSAKEVKEIAKGLVLHYKLDNNGMGNPNLIKNSISAPSSFYDYTSKASVARLESDGVTATNIYAITFPTDSATYSNYNLYTSFTRDTDKAVQKDGKTYTLSFKVKASKPLTNYRFNYEYTSQYLDIDVGTEWKNIKMTGIANGTYSALYLCQGKSNREQINGGTLYVADLKLEEGSKVTPWCPHTSDTIYSQLGLNNNIEYDCSGYGYDGTISGTINIDNASPRYNVADKFEKLGYFKNSNFNVTTKECTISFWVNQKTATSQHFIFGTFSSWTGNGIGFYRDANQQGYNCIFKSDAESSWGSIGTGTIPLNEWHLITYVYNGTQVLRYIDGEYKSTLTYGKNGNIINPVFMIGNSMYQSTPTSENEEASISDVRFYSTALSAEDIKELYQTSASIDKNGNLYAYGLVEE